MLMEYFLIITKKSLIMKKYYLYISLIIVMSLFVSCSSKQKITITGAPGTEIYMPDMEKLGTIGSNGKTKVKIRRDYYPYLLSKRSGSSTLVPFALNYKKDISPTWRLTVGCLFGGLPCIGMPSISTEQFDLNFKYTSPQSANDKIPFVPIIDIGEPKPKYEKPSTTESTTDSSTSIAHRKTSISNRSLKDNAKAVSGTFIGRGSLRKGGIVQEQYKSIKVIITRIDKNNVSVSVIESDESFFSSELRYSVTKSKNGYLLKLSGISSATISIDNDGKLTYQHPKVNIDGDIYTLQINAKKK